MLSHFQQALLKVVKRRIESRYRRILFVHQELAKLNDAEAIPSGSFEDFVFSRIDFSVYKKINAEEFCLLFDEGVSDYEESFYQKAFSMCRDNIRRTINEAYIKEGLFYLCKRAGPLLLSIMRTLHTSLDFAPLLLPDDISREQLLEAMHFLDGQTICHNDGMETKLFVRTQPDSRPILCGTFYPLGKPYTVELVPNTLIC
jgi:hypothetical protein